MTSPVLAALVNARMKEINNTDHAIEAVVTELLGAPPRYIESSPVDFIKWCDGKGLPWRPATPAAVALWIFEHAAMGVDALLAEIAKISAAHASRGMADPTLSWAPTAALNAIIKIDPPRSWPKEDRPMWVALPYAVQQRITKRESERDTMVRRCQNEAADARKKLLALQDVVKGKGEPLRCATGTEEART
jgi:hypothetical protein